MTVAHPQGSQDPTRNDMASLGDAMAMAWLDTIAATGAIPVDMQHRLAWILPQDALADGWRVDTDSAQDTTRDLDADLDLEEVLEEVAGFARLGQDAHGGAYLWLVTKGETDFAAPLEIGETGHDLAAVHALELREVQPIEWGADPEDRGTFGKPTLFRVAPQRGGLAWEGAVVHASRLIYVPSGFRKTPKEQEANGSRDWSVAYMYAKAARSTDTGFESSARLLDRRSVPHLHLKDGAEKVAGSGRRAKLQNYLTTFLTNLVGKGLAVTMGEDTFSFQAPAVSGTPELLTALAWRMCMVEGFSLTKLFGQPPGGLTTDDKAAEKSHNAIVTRTQRNLYTPVLRRIYDVAQGVDPGRRVVWPPTDEPTAKEAADTSLVLAQRDLVLVQGGIISESESRGRFLDGEEVAELVIDGDEAPAEDEPDVPMMPPGFLPPPADDDEEDEAGGEPEPPTEG